MIFFAAFVIVIIPTNFVIYAHLQTILRNADTAELTSETDKLLAKTQLDPLLVPLPPVGYSVLLAMEKDDFYEVIFQSPAFPTLPPAAGHFNWIENDTLTIVTARQPVGSSVLIATMARSNANLQQQQKQLRTYLIWANSGAVGLAAVLVFLASSFVVRPITKIISAAEHIQASKSISRVPVPRSNDESRLLAETLNGMIGRIESAIKNQINFFASATHELKTPLAIMQTEITIALEQSHQEGVHQILENQLTEVQRLSRLIEDFLLISQLKSETMTVRKSTERLDEPLYAAIKKLKYLASEKQSYLQIQIEESIPQFDFDRDKIETVFTNLVENALRYAPTQSTIIISLSQYDSTVHFVIQNRISEPVANIDALTSEFKPSASLKTGLGMGLWICNQIINMHGASMSLHQNKDHFFVSIAWPIDTLGSVDQKNASSES